jgi:hypothetical protein
MTVTAERKGGISGWHERLGPVDTEEAPNGEQIVQAITDADFFNLPAEYPPQQTVRDGYRYSVAVRTDEASSHTVSWETGSQTPDGVRNILTATEMAADWQRVS